MKIKLVDVHSGEPYEAQSGTCELCMGPAYMAEDLYYVFEDSHGDRYSVCGTWWDWGDSFELPHIENVPHFGAWLATLDVRESILEDGKLDWNELHGLIDFYDDFVVGGQDK